jgi:hypothetical protein
MPYVGLLVALLVTSTAGVMTESLSCSIVTPMAAALVSTALLCPSTTPNPALTEDTSDSLPKPRF